MIDDTPSRRTLLGGAAGSFLALSGGGSSAPPPAGQRTLAQAARRELFSEARNSRVGAETTEVLTNGYDKGGRGGARYLRDPAVDAAYVGRQPRTSFLSADGFGFRLATEQTITPFMFGARGFTGFDFDATDFAAIPDDTAPLQAFFDFCTAHDLASVNWGGVFGVTKGLVTGNTTAGTQHLFSGTRAFHGSLVLAVKSKIAGAVLTVRNRRLSTYEALTVAGSGQAARIWSKRLFDVGIHIEDQAQMQVFTTVSVYYARLCGVYNSGRGSSGDNTFQNRILNAYFSYCGSGMGTSLAAPEGHQSATFSGRVDSGNPTDSGQRTRLAVSELPPEAIQSFATDNIKTLPFFALIGSQLYEVKDIDRGASTVSLFPWVDRNAPTTGKLKYVFGGGLITVDGDAGMMDAKVAATGCAIGIQNLATYGGTFQLTAQHNAIGFAQGKDRGNVSFGAVLNLYAEGNDFDFIYNSVGHFVLIAEQAIDIAKVVYFNPRRGDNSLAEHFKPGGLQMNLGGSWHGLEFSEDVDGGRYSVAIDFTQPISKIIPLRGDSVTVTLVNALLPDGVSPAAPHFQRLFGYRARLVNVVGTGPGGRPLGSVTVKAYPGLKINGGAPGAPAVFQGFTGPLQIRLELDPADTANCIVSFVCGKA